MICHHFGDTGLRFSALGFGCGSVGGLMIRGEHRERVAAVARAIELGINYFDTAPAYGQGESETNLGSVLAELGANVHVGTKVLLPLSGLDDVEGTIVASLEDSLKRLKRDYVDLYQLHNYIGTQRAAEHNAVTVSDASAAVDAFRRLQEQGKIRFWGMTALGDMEVVHEAVGSLTMHSIQACYNLLNPTAGMRAPDGFPFQDFARLIDKAAAKGTAVIAIRVLAAGALSGTLDRHPLADRSFGSMASGRDYTDDVRRASLLGFLSQRGHVDSLVEAALRFVISNPGVTTALVGFSSLEQLEYAVQCVDRGPLSQETIDRIAGVMTLQSQVGRY